MLSDEKVIPICRFWANKLWKRGQDFDELVSVAYCNLKTLDEKTDTKLLHGWAKFSIIQHITNKSIVSLPHITVEAKQEKLQNFVENYPLVLKELKKEKTDQDQIADLREAFKILNTDELDLIYLYFWRGGNVEMRNFDTGALRDTLDGKLSFSKGLCPKVLEDYLKYLDKHRNLPDGSKREFDNWKKGIPKDVYLDSLIRHVWAVWLLMLEFDEIVTLKDSLHGVMFNTMGLLYEINRDEEKSKNKRA